MSLRFILERKHAILSGGVPIAFVNGGVDMSDLDEMKRIRVALETIAAAVKKVVDEGITIYTHQDGDEAKN